MRFSISVIVRFNRKSYVNAGPPPDSTHIDPLTLERFGNVARPAFGRQGRGSKQRHGCGISVYEIPIDTGAHQLSGLLL